MPTSVAERQVPTTLRSRGKKSRVMAEKDIDGACDGCSPGLAEMYLDYIEGRRELRDINMEFNARYTSGATGPDRGGCGFAG